jgi:hypothetical protein
MVSFVNLSVEFNNQGACVTMIWITLPMLIEEG